MKKLMVFSCDCMGMSQSYWLKYDGRISFRRAGGQVDEGAQQFRAGVSLKRSLCEGPCLEMAAGLCF